MLKLIVTIDCDICRESFQHIALSCDRGPEAWQYLAATLEATADDRGWNLYGGVHECQDCVSNLMLSADQPDAHFAEIDEHF